MLFRIRIVSALFFMAFLVLIFRLFYWQIYNTKKLSIQARSQYTLQGEVLALRGDILASDGSWLVANEEAWLVYASLKDIKEDSRRISEKLAPIFLNIPYDKNALLVEIDRLFSLLEKDDVVWVPLKQKVNSVVKKNIEALKIEGIGFEQQERRVYPESSSAAHIIGFVGKNESGEDQGYFGLEGYYDMTLSGKPGYSSRESDALGVPIAIGNFKEVSAIKGVNLLTNIDKAVQLVTERKLSEGIEKYGALGGTAIVMEPESGAILGMSSYPSYDAGEYWKFGDAFFRNPATSDSFEPGSIFKIIVMAAALDAGVVDVDTKCEICGGPHKIDKYTIETWNRSYNPDSSMVDVVVNSDNVGMVFVSEKLGIENMYSYLKKFGIGARTGIDLQGEFSPKLRELDEWSSVDLATASFGQGIAVTPIQMIRAASVIANGGKLVTPRVVKKIISGDFEQVLDVPQETKVISSKSAGKITAMMVEAAKKGESKWTHVSNFSVAGKTGTAQIPISGHYDEEKTIASFIGFAPYNKPKFIMLVTLHEPKTSPWASETAAPLWYSIAQDLFLFFGIQPS